MAPVLLGQKMWYCQTKNTLQKQNYYIKKWKTSIFVIVTKKLMKFNVSVKRS